MAIPLDTYYDPSLAGAAFQARGYASIGGNDVFFYVSDTNELRAKQASSAVQSISSMQILAAGVKFLSLVQAAGVAHLYYSLLNGTIYYAPYSLSNFRIPITPTLTGLNTLFTFSACYAPNSTPAAYAMIIDDGVRHTIVTSSAPGFLPILGTKVVFDNGVDPLHYVSNPVMSVHPQDTNVATIMCEQTLVSNDTTKVGFYCTALPGVS